MNKFFSSIRLTEGPGHDRLETWQAGAKNGELILTKGTGKALSRILNDYTDEFYHLINGINEKES